MARHGKKYRGAVAELQEESLFEPREALQTV